ncbi:L10-interacting MYB domain-containing protein-like [Tripterygium wilfordii]|uniref:L10-interacting MYB domain-containing protein-like n=1 Tax=Tripterygium wilfordii TaxID=458696 RepID=UPI0018F81F56|nr:L10-interacting MYB domain-containing protein-like [Tripterygium wilfordii]
MAHQTGSISMFSIGTRVNASTIPQTFTYNDRMSQHNTNVTEENSQTDKANWDASLTKAFIDICVDRQKAGDRPNTHFTKEEWRLWEKLLIGETGLGWDPIRQTVLADNEWWERKIKQNKKCAKFRNHGIKNKDELNFLFGGQGATGVHAFNPSADPPTEDVAEGSQPTEQRQRGLEDLLSGDEDSTDPEYDVNADVNADVQSSPNPPPRGSRRSNTPAPRGRQKRKDNDVREEISNSLGQLVAAVNSRTSVGTTVSNNGDIDDVMLILEEFPETANGGPLLRCALKLFEKRENRDWFLRIGRRKWQLEWLMAKFEESTGGGPSDA